MEHGHLELKLSTIIYSIVINLYEKSEVYNVSDAGCGMRDLGKLEVTPVKIIVDLLGKSVADQAEGSAAL
jgi:hypothetical protein